MACRSGSRGVCDLVPLLPLADAAEPLLGAGDDFRDDVADERGGELASNKLLSARLRSTLPLAGVGADDECDCLRGSPG